MNRTVPVFYACDDNFVKYTIVSVRSLIDNADKTRSLRVHILHTGISDDMKKDMLSMQKENVVISFDDVTSYLSAISKKLPIRDYYSSATYYRLIIPAMFPEYAKAIYIDSDTVVLGDISRLYDTDIKDNYLGAAHEQVMVQTDVYGAYTERVLGIDRHTYFNAGVLLLNCEQFRQKGLLLRFVKLLQEYNFVVTQDQDYLNVICKDRVFWLDQQWNAEVFGTIPCREEDIKIIHYIMTSKPWHYADCRLSGHFWAYAARTPIEPAIRAVLAAYTDKERKADALVGQRLMQTAKKEINKDNNYLKLLEKRRSHDRNAALKKIQQFEKEGKFDIDIENDPPSKALEAADIDYLRKGIVGKTKTRLAFGAARLFVGWLIRRKQLILRDIVGLENFACLRSGAIVTCNHFNAFDSFVIQLAYYASKQKKRKFYRIIKEGNYTSFPGFYGFLMKNCNTLPLSSNYRTMKKFIESTKTLLQDGNLVLVYPEQSMWWNYRKPKPLKDGAFKFAVDSDVPVLPCFITMKDSDILGKDGFYVQEYTVHIGRPIYPDKEKPTRERIAALKERNFLEWKRIYEDTYGIPLAYSTDTDPAYEPVEADTRAVRSKLAET
jgi:lipopolysaccharide biosynthesis glycosyltransferase/1-acyl-sn-glycerol-3-phosphate acyltransferase